MKKITLLILTVSFISSGCVATAKRTGFLKDYDNLEKGEFLERFWVDKSYSPKQTSAKIVLKDIDVGSISDQKGITIDACKEKLEESILVFSNFVKPGDTGSEAADLSVELAITEMNPGSSFGRMFAGELGMGHAFVQIDGKITSVSSNKIVATMSDKRRASGDIGFKDLGGDAGPALVQDIIAQIAADIAQEVEATILNRN